MAFYLEGQYVLHRQRQIQERDEKRYMCFTSHLRTFGLIKDPAQLQGGGWSGRRGQIQRIIYSKRGHSCALELLQVGSKRLENLQNNTPSEMSLFKWNRNIYPCSGLTIQFYISEIHLVRFANVVTSFFVIRLLGEQYDRVLLRRFSPSTTSNYVKSDNGV